MFKTRLLYLQGKYTAQASLSSVTTQLSSIYFHQKIMFTIGKVETSHADQNKLGLQM